MLLLSGLSLSFAPDAPPALSFGLSHDGTYSLLVGGTEWFRSAKQTVCSAGVDVSLTFSGTKEALGHDAFGDWTGTTASYANASIRMDITFKRYAAASNFLVGTATFPAGLNTSGCGTNQQISTRFPTINTSAARASTLDTLSWRAGVISVTAVAKGLNALGANGLDCGPVVSTDSSVAERPTLVWSTLDNHKIVPQETVNGTYSMGIAAAIPSLPAGFSHSILFTVAAGGATAGTYFWGELIQRYHGMSASARLPSVTLSNVGYYTDDGAYYYVWGGNVNGSDPQLSGWIPRRPWPAEEGLLLVAQTLRKQGVPIGYMQLDDWWYSGRFFFGNVKAVADWHASNSSGLFPHGLPAFAEKLGLPLQLYTPFFDNSFATPYRTFESSAFGGTKLPVPDDSYAFFSDLFDLGKQMTGGRFDIYEIDFLDANFAGCVACFADTTAAERWYAGMARAALERNISIQYCLPSATDMLASLAFPAVVQARASGDYAREEGDMAPDGNVVTLGGASLLLGATLIAPSKDTLWTRSPQPPTSSDRAHSGLKTAPHVELDAILATLSLGPVGISDGLNQTDVGLIGQAYRSETDGTLLRPSRPLSTIDAVWTNYSNSRAANWSAPHAADIARGISDGSVSDVRATHAAVGGDGGEGGEGVGSRSHYVLAWMTTREVTLQPTDLYPRPPPAAMLAVRKHIVAPAGDAQLAGCVDGQPAVPSCVDVLPAGTLPVLPPVATKATDITAYGFWAVYEPAANGAYLLGELTKFVHVAPQRFARIAVAGSGPCGLTVAVKGSPGESVQIAAVDPDGILHVATAKIAASGLAEAAI